MRHISFELESLSLTPLGERKFSSEPCVLVYWLEFSKDPEQPPEMRKSTPESFFSDVGGGDVLFTAYSLRDMQLLFRLLGRPEPEDVIFSSTSANVSFYLEKVVVV